VHEVGGEPDDEADREVDLAADQQEHLAQGDDRDARRVSRGFENRRDEVGLRDEGPRKIRG